jgi:NAD(P)-dependent dehydrogenase (short-subunit alcohol dehydrogenase family)
MGSLDGRSVLITGGSSGIGLATAQLLLEEGAAVTISGRDRERLAQAAKELAGVGGVQTVVGDVANARDVDTMVKAAVDHAEGRLDYVFCNAGIPGVAPIEDLTEELWDRVLGVNLKGTYLVVRAALPHLKASGDAAIVTMGSEAGITGQPDLAAYCASKGAVVNLTRALALELIPFGIRVNCLCPGITNTPMCEVEANMAPDPAAVWKKWETWAPAGRWADPREQAKAVLYLLRDATFMVGSVLVSDGGYTAL